MKNSGNIHKWPYEPWRVESSTLTEPSKLLGSKLKEILKLSLDITGINESLRHKIDKSISEKATVPEAVNRTTRDKVLIDTFKI